MLATLVREPFHKPGWEYEEKYDGYRILAYKEGDRVTLRSRNAKDRTTTFPAIARAVAALGAETVLLDGEVVAFDRLGISHFQFLQNLKSEPVYAVFDCLYLNGRDLRRQPLSARRLALEGVVPKGVTIFPTRSLDKDGFKAYRLAKQKHYEGIVAKDESAPYVEGRSTLWLKVKVHQEEEFVIAGYTAPTGSRRHFGALLLGAYSLGEFQFIGKVGTGFTQELLAKLFRMFQPLVRTDSAFAKAPRGKHITYLTPKLVAQIAFQEWTADNKLRQPVFLGLRDDKKPEECILPSTTRNP